MSASHMRRPTARLPYRHSDQRLTLIVYPEWGVKSSVYLKRGHEIFSLITEAFGQSDILSVHVNIYADPSKEFWGKLCLIIL
jgi:hypothetical protein